ncbi:MAG TPA: triose-phosphate isomerase [Candidatus Melainabacteria bacterium]|nr:triose-phosphate isomerase [Candidatus Melainabacteria bacterium]
MTKRKTIIAGNWKMFKTRKEATELASAVAAGCKGEKDLPEVVLIPPFTSIESALNAIKDSPVSVGAQNMDWRDNGAFTGEVSPVMLTELGVKYVLIGHSERRQFFGETNQTVNQRLKAALAHKLIPIVCVGETLDERESGLTDSVVRRQVGAALAEIPPEALEIIVVAYEPVWAIGTGKVCEADEANRVLGQIRATIADLYKEGGNSGLADQVPLLYGGSVKPSNIEEQMAKPEIDGALVGGASLKAEEFLPLIKAGQKRVQGTAKDSLSKV